MKVESDVHNVTKPLQYSIVENIDNKQSRRRQPETAEETVSDSFMNACRGISRITSPAHIGLYTFSFWNIDLGEGVKFLKHGKES